MNKWQFPVSKLGQRTAVSLLLASFYLLALSPGLVRGAQPGSQPAAASAAESGQAAGSQKAKPPLPKAPLPVYFKLKRGPEIANVRFTFDIGQEEPDEVSLFCQFVVGQDGFFRVSWRGNIFTIMGKVVEKGDDYAVFDGAVSTTMRVKRPDGTTMSVFRSAWVRHRFERGQSQEVGREDTQGTYFWSVEGQLL